MVRLKSKELRISIKNTVFKLYFALKNCRMGRGAVKEPAANLNQFLNSVGPAG